MQNGIQGLSGEIVGELHIGKQGPKGDPFTYEDFTSEQLAALKGKPGKDGYTPQKGVDYFDGLDGKDGKTPVKGDDYWTDTDKQEIVAEVISSDDISKIKQDIIDLRADLEYTGIKITGMSISHSTAEVGLSIYPVTVRWSLNKLAKTQTVNGEDVHLSLKQWSESVSSDKTFTLRVTDERDNEDTKSVSIKFLNGVYYGVAETPETLDSAFILNLIKQLKDNKQFIFNVNAAEGQHIWYACPAKWGDCSFTVGGFTGGFTLVDTIEFRTMIGYTESYNVYASVKTGLGVTRVEVS